MSVQYTDNISLRLVKKVNFQMKKSDFFSYFCSKAIDRWVHVMNRLSEAVLTSMLTLLLCVLNEQIVLKNMNTPVNPT